MRVALNYIRLRSLASAAAVWTVAGSSHGVAAELQREYVSAPLLGSGNAGTTDVYGLDSLFYNPANLARTPKVVGDVVLVSPHIEASQNGLSLYKDIQSNKNMLDVVGGAVGRPVSLALQNATGASFRRTAFALFQRADLDIAVKNNPISGIPVATAASAVRAGVAFGLGRSFSGNALHFGVTGLIVQKAEAQLEVSALDAQTKLGKSGGKSVLDDAVKRGVGVGAHASLMLTPGGASSPEFVLVARNLGLSYGVGGKPSSEQPSAEIQTIDFGFSLQPGTKKSRSRISLDLDDVLNKSKQNIYKRLHMGAEVTFSEILGVLGGLNQGYSTYGIFINSKIIRIDAGLFAEEMGKYPGDSKNRSYYGRVSVGWAK
ncbi:MAG: hypothetical protein FJY29_08715 [Betaproteobacteria bacterium]|nr:hypothetical protein [Betaproteobacteria bacterium]